MGGLLFYASANEYFWFESTRPARALRSPLRWEDDHSVKYRVVLIQIEL